jgi:hypothetical protein
LVTRRQPYLGIGYVLTALIGIGAALALESLGSSWFLSRYSTPTPAEVGSGIALGLVIVYAAFLAAMAIHELGHYLPMLMLRVPVTALYLGSPPRLISFGRRTRVHLGPIPHGRAQWRSEPTPGRAAIIRAAGPAANLLTSPLPLILPVSSALRYSLALIFAATGVSNLMPYRARTGRLSDGAMLLRTPARSRTERDLRSLRELPDWTRRPEAAEVVLRGCRLELATARALAIAVMPLLRDLGHTRDVFWLHQLELPTPDSPKPELVHAVHYAEWVVASIPGLPIADANLAGRRLAWVLKHISGDDRPAVMHTLAVVRLRQGLHAEVEPLCAEALAGSLEPAARATVLATIAMARHAIGLPGREALDEALALDRDAELVGEAVARLSKPTKSRPVKARRLRSGASRSDSTGTRSG